MCYRLARAGWQVHFTPWQNVIHMGEQVRVNGGSIDSSMFRESRAVSPSALLRNSLMELFITVECFALARSIRDVLALRLA